MKGYSTRFSRSTLLTIHICFILPIEEYSDVVWMNWTSGDKESLENVNRSVIRIAIGAKVGTSHAKLYEESGLEMLSVRKDIKKIMMYQISRNRCECQLCVKDFQIGSERNRYSMRSTGLLSIPKCRTVTYQTSFLPSGINLWNSMNNDLKNLLRPKLTVNKL